MIFYTIAILVLFLAVVWLMFAVVNILKALDSMQHSDDTIMDCVKVLYEMIRKGRV